MSDSEDKNSKVLSILDRRKPDEYAGESCTWEDRVDQDIQELCVRIKQQRDYIMQQSVVIEDMQRELLEQRRLINRILRGIGDR